MIGKLVQLALAFFYLMIGRPRSSTLFPYTTLFRSADALVCFNRLFDAARGVAYGGWDLSDRNLRVLDSYRPLPPDRKSTRLNSSHANISYAVFCLKKKNASSRPMAPRSFATS